MNRRSTLIDVGALLIAAAFVAAAGIVGLDALGRLRVPASARNGAVPVVDVTSARQPVSASSGAPARAAGSPVAGSVDDRPATPAPGSLPDADPYQWLSATGEGIAPGTGPGAAARRETQVAADVAAGPVVAAAPEAVATVDGFRGVRRTPSGASAPQAVLLVAPAGNDGPSGASGAEDHEGRSSDRHGSDDEPRSTGH